jgi:hypothetical protein
VEYDDLTALSATATLAAVEARARARRAGDVQDLLHVLHWCDLHSADPQGEPGAVPKSRGGNYLRRIGGDGTPEVADLCFAELAIARGAGEMSTANLAADALDLKHRMPLLWAAVLDLRIEVWLARKIARMTRMLSKDRIGLVDAAVVVAVRESPGRLLEIAEAKVIEADPDLHRAKLEEDAQRTGVWLSRVRPGEIVDEATGEPATRRLSAKLPMGSAVRCEETIEDLSEAIFDHTEPDENGNRPSRQECRLLAFEMLTTQPHRAAAFLDSLDPDPSVDPTPASPKPKHKPRPATIVVHLTDRVLSGQPGVARVEGIGPVLLDKLSDLLAGRDLAVQPVIDLAAVKSVNGYEHPTAVKERTLLRTLGDVFPHSTSRGTARLDHDHPTPYDPQGPPGQTGDLSDAPLTRRHHRAKTHLGYRCDQIGLGAYRWITPHGLARLVTPTGTRKIELLRDPGGSPVGEVYDGPCIAFGPGT